MPGSGNVARTNAYVLEGGRWWVEPVGPRDEVDGWLALGRERKPEAILYSHHHPDHVGFTQEIADALGVPIWAPPISDVPPHRTVRVDRVIEPGMTVGRYSVIATPGHQTGHVSFWDGQVLVLGDAHLPGDGWPHEFFSTTDTLIALDPEYALPAHGKPYLQHSLKRALLMRALYGKGMP